VILAIDIGGTNFRVAVSTESGQLVKVVRRSTDANQGAPWMIDQLSGLVADLSTHRFRAIGIGFGGPVDYGSQRIINSTHVAGWDDVALGEILSNQAGVPSVIDNDANFGALGEFAYGAGRGSRHMVYYTVSTGIGGGIILDGDVYRGANGNAGELGHVPILKGSPKCACGNVGCLEALCSGPAIGARGSRRLGQPGLSAKDVFDLARNGDTKALSFVTETAEYLGMGIASAINTLAPDRVVVGGGVARAGKVLFDPLRASVRDRVMPVHRKEVRILPAKRGDRAVLLGAVAAACRL